MILKEKLSIDASARPNEIILFAEGTFLKAYERSAWLFCHLVRPYSVRKRFVKVIGDDVVSLGFPNTTDLPVRKFNDTLPDVFVLDINDETDVSALPEFGQWKAGIALYATEPKHSDNLPEEGIGQNSDEKCERTEPVPCSICSIIERIRSFPMESKTPMECMLFLVELKKLANGSLY